MCHNQAVKHPKNISCKKNKIIAWIRKKVKAKQPPCPFKSEAEWLFVMYFILGDWRKIMTSAAASSKARYVYSC